MDVLSAANELMLDRLSQICQEVIGRFVNARNVCGLLNAISPSSVHEFKDAALEYLCLSLESMLQGHHLNELDEDLLHELDNVARGNQLACMPFAKSGRAEVLLHERHPEVAAVIDRNRQAKVDAASLRSKHLGIETLTPGALGDDLPSSPSQQKARRKSSSQMKSDRPSLKAKASSRDMMFTMDDEQDTDPQSPTQSPSIRPRTGAIGLASISSSPPEPQYDSGGLELALPATPQTPLMSGKNQSSSTQPWSATPLATPKTDMRDIMAQAASSRTSSLSQGLAATRASIPDGPSAISLPAPRMSQKDRKRLQQAQQLQQPAKTMPQDETRPEVSGAKTTPAWQSVGGPPKGPSLKEALGAQGSSDVDKPVTARATSTPQLTMRQTVAHAKPSHQPPTPVTGPSGQSALQQRSVSDAKPATPASAQQSRQLLPPQASNSKPIPQSIRHQPPLEPVHDPFLKVPDIGNIHDAVRVVRGRVVQRGHRVGARLPSSSTA